MNNNNDKAISSKETAKSMAIIESSISNPEFTIVVPTYNRVRTLKDTLQSVLNQLGDNLNYEVTVVDNNPDRHDETEIFVSSLAYHHLNYYKNEQNLGMAGNWNRAFELARTENVIMVHDDDIVSPYLLSNIKKILIRYPQAIVVGTEKIVWNENDPYLPQMKCKEKKYNVLQYSLLSQFDYYRFGAPTGILIKRNALLRCGGFKQELYPSLDYGCICELIKTGMVLKYNKPLVIYRVGINESLNIETRRNWIKKDNEVRNNIMTTIKINNLLFRYTRSNSYVNQSLLDGDDCIQIRLKKHIFVLIHKILDIYWSRKLIIDKI